VVILYDIHQGHRCRPGRFVAPHARLHLSAEEKKEE